MKIGKLNIADYFSLYRFVAVPVIVVCIVLHARVLTAILLLISFITDAIDGYLARKKNIVTKRGAKLDSYGDLLTLAVGLAAFIVFETDFFLRHLTVFIIACCFFALQILIAVIRFKQVTSYHTYLAKTTAVFLALFLVITPLAGPIRILYYITAILGIAEAIEEIVITLMLKKPEENVKGIYWLLKERRS